MRVRPKDQPRRNPSPLGGGQAAMCPDVKTNTPLRANLRGNFVTSRKQTKQVHTRYHTRKPLNHPMSPRFNRPAAPPISPASAPPSSPRPPAPPSPTPLFAPPAAQHEPTLLPWTPRPLRPRRAPTAGSPSAPLPARPSPRRLAGARPPPDRRLPLRRRRRRRVPSLLWPRFQPAPLPLPVLLLLLLLFLLLCWTRCVPQGGPASAAFYRAASPC